MSTLNQARPEYHNLFAYPAQPNVTGEQHPLDWIQEAHGRGWDVLVDCAAFVPTNRLDLSSWHPAFVPLTFYKIFGYPTGVGFLLAGKSALAKLRRPWYAGGTITLSSIIAANMLERKEEGEVTNEQNTCNTAFKTHSWSLRPSG